MREYSYSTPRILWNPDARELVFAFPDACEEHEDSYCLCWVGPWMFEAVENWKATQDGPGPSMSAVCRAFVECMEGVTEMYEPTGESADQMEQDDTDQKQGSSHIWSGFV